MLTYDEHSLRQTARKGNDMGNEFNKMIVITNGLEVYLEGFLAEMIKNGRLSDENKAACMARKDAVIAWAWDQSADFFSECGTAEYDHKAEAERIIGAYNKVGK